MVDNSPGVVDTQPGVVDEGTVNADDSSVVTGPSDYLSGSTDSDQCALPISQRTKNWWCPNTTPESARLAQQHAAAALARQGVAAEDLPTAAADDPPYCTVDACWGRTDDATTTFTGTGIYGTILGKLGDTELYFKVTFNGGTHKSYPFWFSASRATATTILSGERLYWSPGCTSGCRMNPPHYFQRSFGLHAGGVSSQWKKPGPHTWENTVAWVTVVHEATWTDTSSAYPGDWFMWGKSVLYGHHKNGSYHATSDSNVPDNPTGSGWKE